MTGVFRNYSDMTNGEISQLVTINGKYRILKLQDVFDRYKKTQHYVIELKENAMDVMAFANIIKRNHMQDYVTVQATDVDALDQLEVIFPHMKKLLIVKDQASFEQACSEPNVDIVSGRVSSGLIRKENVELAHSNGKEANFWTLNSTDEIITAIKIGVDSYFTDYTGKAFSLEKAYRK